MANYLIKFKGKFRLKSHIDKTTNDFPRDENGKLDTDDVYIDCAKGCQIYHYGKSILVAYIPSVGRGHNIIKAIFCDIANGKIDDYMIKTGETKEGVTTYRTEWNNLYKDKLLNNYISDILETDNEIEFRFHAKNIDIIAKYLEPKTSGANISPLSPRNLPKRKYAIPNDDLDEYKKITSNVKQGDLLIISRYTTSFFDDILSKDMAYRTTNFKIDMKKNMLKGKEYIHSIGEWERYLKYLKERIDNE